MKIVEKLREFGCEVTRDELYRIIREVVTEYRPGVPPDWIVVRPDTHEFCERLRERLGAQIPDMWLLHWTLNHRKAGAAARTGKRGSA
jgi:hypothetical protein